MHETMHIFYACDDAFVKYTAVSLSSMIRHADPAGHYHAHILYTSVADSRKEQLLSLKRDNWEITFDDVSAYLDSIKDALPIRDYYSKTTYYRLFISDMFPDIDKALYIDSDTVVQGDIRALFATELGDHCVGACHEQAMVQVDVYGTYAEEAVGVSRHSFFNAGILLINGRQFREKRVLEQFIRLLSVYNFTVTQDEDYLNVLCKDRVYWLDQRWNTEIFGEIPYPIEEAVILHYIMTNKPWHYEDCRHGDLFWAAAKETPVYDELRNVLAAYTDEERARDRASCERLEQLAAEETRREDNYVRRLPRAADRVAVLKTIAQFEREGRFDEDVEEDPPGRVLMPDEIDYIRRGAADRFKAKLAFWLAHRFLKKQIKQNNFILREIRGLEHFRNLRSGAVITCNHFNAFDSFAIQLAYEAAGQKARTFYRIIREGNYTSFPGFYGMLMRHCNTLPLSSNRQTMKKFLTAVNRLLQEGHFVLVYPEQGMWWNYRKPRPLKKTAFGFAAKNHVPVLPCFITMRDSDVIGKDGFPVQEYTIHIHAPLAPDPALSDRRNADEMAEKNRLIWQEIYEREYGLPLRYP